MIESRHLDKRESALANGLILAELAIQVVGGLFYAQVPGFFWALADAILIMVPLAFGIGRGLLCLAPMAVSEVAWAWTLRSIGPALHLVSFAVTVVLLGLASNRILEASFLQRKVRASILFEVSLLGEEVFYHFLRSLFLSHPMRWDEVLTVYLSPANLLVLSLLILCVGIGEENKPFLERL